LSTYYMLDPVVATGDTTATKGSPSWRKERGDEL
jgi:hypothetical protein